jgi:hypothetical protein
MSETLLRGITQVGWFGTITLIILIALALYFYLNSKKEVKNGRTKN